jgi:hypothetical protein
MKKIVFVSGLLLLNCVMTAQNVGRQKAAIMATSFMMHQTPERSDLTITDTLEEKENGVSVYYIFLFQEDGFIITSANEAVTPVLGYSTESKFDKNNIPTNVANWLEQYKQQIYSQIIVANANIHHQNLWNDFLNRSPKNNPKSVSPLCTTKWDQGCFYNELCPSDTFGQCNHVATGCVATAMAQIMKYWNYPLHGSGTHSYVDLVYGPLFADFGATTYQWGLMNDSVIAPNPAVATLMYHCGVALEMEYGSTSSGSYLQTDALTQYFKYSPNALYIFSYNFDSAGWINRLETELDAGRPIWYTGMPHPPMPTGHAWVCDGYDNNDFFHFNWGWGGNSDGYFQMGNFVFPLSNSAVVNIMPVQNYDVAVKGLVSPVSSTFTVPENIRVRVANYDTIAHYNIPIAYKVDNGAEVNDTITDTIAPLSEIVFEFAQAFDFSTLPGHTYNIDIYTAASSDAYRNNDTMTFAIENVLCSDPTYTMGFETNESMAGWRIDDVNHDGNTWIYGSMGGHSGPWCAYTTSGAQVADDWLISKCISLNSSKLYKLSFWYKSTGIYWPQNLRVFMGNSNALPSLDSLLTDITSITDNNYQQQELWIKVPVSGSYYFGWYCYSDSNMLSLILDDIEIDELNAIDIGIPESLSPSDGCDQQLEPVTVKVRNYCSSIISDIPISYNINGGPPQHDTVAGPIPIGGSVNFTFTVPADLSLAGSYSVRVCTSLPADTLHQNDTIKYNVTNHLSAVLPYSMGFETIEDYSEWVIEDVNEDGYTWSIISSGGHNGPSCVRYYYHYLNAANDWIITKCVHLKPGTTYRLGFWHKIEDPTWPENLAVYYGLAANSTFLNTMIIDLPGLTNTSWTQSQPTFSVPVDGFYYIGWKCYSYPMMFNLYIDDIYLEEITTSINSPEPDASFMVYPNPGSGSFFVTDNNKENGEKNYEVYNPMGNLIQKGQIINEPFELKLFDEPSGVYLLRIITEKGNSVIRLVKK